MADSASRQADARTGKTSGNSVAVPTLPIMIIKAKRPEEAPFIERFQN
jgi:hypothetical protein